MTNNTLNPKDYVHARIRETTPEAPPDLEGRLISVLGGLQTWERPPLAPEVTEVRQMDGYRRETVVFTTRPGLSAFGYFLLPDNVQKPVPAVLCLPGHGRGVDSLVGIAEDGTQRPLSAPDEYQKDYALGCVAHGYAVFALEQISFGHRRDEKAKAAGGVCLVLHPRRNGGPDARRNPHRLARL
jgi:hypothetical protein